MTSDASDEDKQMAVNMLVTSIMGALRAREAAARVLLPEIDDVNTALISALTISLGLLMAARCHSDTQYQRGVQVMLTNLHTHRADFRQYLKTVPFE